MQPIIYDSLKKVSQIEQSFSNSQENEKTLEKDIVKGFKSLPFIDSEDYVIKTSILNEKDSNISQIGILDPMITDTLREGLYVAYLFNDEKASIYLTIKHGFEETSQDKINKINENIRNIEWSNERIQKEDTINLGNDQRAINYENQVIIYIEYDANSLPGEIRLREDLLDMLEIYKNYLHTNTKSFPFLEKNIEALKFLGGEAHLSDIYKYIENHYSEQLVNYKSWKEPLRASIYRHSSDTNIFKGVPGDENDIFYTVKGKGEGHWGLRELQSNYGEKKLSNIKEVVDHVYEYITSKGFYYTKEEVANLYISLKTKQFVIISGISGTGKTKIAQLFAESLGATDENGRFTLIPVRPDWSDGSDLLGYVDLTGKFKEGPLTKVLKNARTHPDLPYIVVLDEMNLSRVEYYFSDILSILESRKRIDGNIVTSNIIKEELAGFNLSIPNNVYFIGTVNMDETTYPFSKKVLDRAMTLEFNHIDLSNLSFLQQTKNIPEVYVLQNKCLASNFLHLKDAYEGNEELINKVIDELVNINNILKDINAHIGYRVRDEVCFYMIYAVNENIFSFDQAFDYCIMQKILPRIHGSDRRIEHVLKKLLVYLTNIEYEAHLEEHSSYIDNSRFPQSTEKTLDMLRRLDDGFTSFWIT